MCVVPLFRRFTCAFLSLVRFSCPIVTVFICCCKMPSWSPSFNIGAHGVHESFTSVSWSRRHPRALCVRSLWIRLRIVWNFVLFQMEMDFRTDENGRGQVWQHPMCRGSWRHNRARVGTEGSTAPPPSPPKKKNKTAERPTIRRAGSARRCGHPFRSFFFLQEVVVEQSPETHRCVLLFVPKPLISATNKRNTAICAVSAGQVWHESGQRSGDAIHGKESLEVRTRRS